MKTKSIEEGILCDDYVLTHNVPKIWLHAGRRIYIYCFIHCTLKNKETYDAEKTNVLQDLH